MLGKVYIDPMSCPRNATTRGSVWLDRSLNIPKNKPYKVGPEPIVMNGVKYVTPLNGRKIDRELGL